MVKIFPSIKYFNPDDQGRVESLLGLDRSRTLYVDMSDSVTSGALGNGALEVLCTHRRRYASFSYLVYDPGDINRISKIIPAARSKHSIAISLSAYAKQDQKGKQKPANQNDKQGSADQESEIHLEQRLSDIKDSAFLEAGVIVDAPWQYLSPQAMHYVSYLILQASEKLQDDFATARQRISEELERRERIKRTIQDEIAPTSPLVPERPIKIYILCTTQEQVELAKQYNPEQIIVPDGNEIILNLVEERKAKRLEEETKRSEEGTKRSEEGTKTIEGDEEEGTKIRQLRRTRR